MFKKAALKVKKANGKSFFKRECIDLSPYRTARAVSYCCKQINDTCLSRLKPLWKSGLTDDLDDFGHSYR